MKSLLNPEFNLYEKDGKPLCDSLMVAEAFKKQHAHVLRDIESTLEIFNKINQSKFGEINFIQSSYKDGKNRNQPKYMLTKDGFTYLTMGYEGERAAQFKIDYMTRFNRMEAFIKSLLATKIEFPAFTEAIMLTYDEPKHYHFSNEINMIYRIVIGMDAKSFRKMNGLSNGEVIKPYLTLEQIKAVEALQRADIGLNASGMDYTSRKQILENYYEKTHFKLTA